MRSKRGFTLIELLVVIAIIALLLSIIMPALNKVKDVAKRVLDSNSQDQCMTAVHARSADNNGDVIQNYRSDSGKLVPATPTELPDPFRSYMVYYPEEKKKNGEYKPYNLAVLYDEGYIDIPKIFYCPAQPRNSEYEIKYYYEFYIGEGNPDDYGDVASDVGHYEWGTYLPSDTRGSSSKMCRTSYNYWVYGETKLAKLNSYKPIIVDNIQEWEVVPHRKKINDLNSDPQGLTVAFADGHVSFCSDRKIFEDRGDDGPWDIPDPCPDGITGNGPGNTLAWFQEILKRLEGN